MRFVSPNLASDMNFKVKTEITAEMLQFGARKELQICFITLNIRGRRSEWNKSLLNLLSVELVVTEARLKEILK